MDISRLVLFAIFNEEIHTDVVVDFAKINDVKQEWKVVYFNDKEYPLDFVMHKAKRFAMARHLKRINSNVILSGGRGEAIITNVPLDSFSKVFHAESEEEAVLDALEWIIRIEGNIPLVG